MRVDDTEVTITYGRIGEQGQVRSATFADHAKALKAAEKKIGEKVRKGYAPAVRGVRGRRAVSRREIVSTGSTAHQAPVLWRFERHRQSRAAAGGQGSEGRRALRRDRSGMEKHRPPGRA
ncbi:putative DNA-binding WGR domain protein [Saccharothrix tamanrassetensis]|uniref:Putative DNA-binding WGR domain protein n=1 Tax=Saccharothrix tamanrassetensis TaxID=1051531 RepID=A0A841CUQ4_9PSEU|nr:WGR domain-containing protein [Saccharothrix tamanrassetensis]MBB5959757.1 putative DNA-binding WGR domain protein [Saccharothrix tamanrassetensis]